MQSANDRAFYDKVGPEMAGIQKDLFVDRGIAENVARYRAMIDKLDQFKHSPFAPSVAKLVEGAEILPGLFADIAVPHGNGPFPVVLHVHGNAFLAGNPASFRRTTLDFARLGYVTVMPDYRLAPEHPFPAALDDVTAALRWIGTGIGTYGGDAGRLILTGNSSGAGLAFAAARALSGSGVRLRAIAGFDGHYDRRDEPRSWLQDAYLGPDCEALLADPRVSPNIGLEKGMLPPVLLTTGSGDFAAPNTLSFGQTLARLGIEFELHVLPGARHDAMRYPHLDVSKDIFDLFARFAQRALA